MGRRTEPLVVSAQETTHEVVREATRELIRNYMSKEAMSLSRVTDDLAVYTESEIIEPVSPRLQALAHLGLQNPKPQAPSL